MHANDPLFACIRVHSRIRAGFEQAILTLLVLLPAVGWVWFSPVRSLRSMPQQA